MDKETLSNYGWVVIAILVLTIMIALATPFGTYIGNAVKSTTEGLFDVQQKALGAAGMVIGNQSFEDSGNGECNTPEQPIVAGATFDGGVTLTWEELKLEENGTKYGYDASKITDTEIGIAAFANSSITSITIPDSVTSIGEYAFLESSLTSVTIPYGLPTIGNSAFDSCYSLTSITIPDSVTYIGDIAFYACRSLTSITFKGAKAQWNAITFGDSWNYAVPATVVHCSDGDITL